MDSNEMIDLEIEELLGYIDDVEDKTYASAAMQELERRGHSVPQARQMVEDAKEDALNINVRFDGIRLFALFLVCIMMFPIGLIFSLYIVFARGKSVAGNKLPAYDRQTRIYAVIGFCISLVESSLLVFALIQS